MSGSLWRACTGAAAAAVVTVAVAACSQTVPGTAERPPADPPDEQRSYGYVDDRCGLLDDDAVRDLLGANNVVRPFSGAVCQYVLATDRGLIGVVFSWFDRGTLARERAVAAERGSRITDVELTRQPAFLARRPDNPDACSATVDAGSGVLTWWVQHRPGGDDACRDAEKLLIATLSADS